MKIPTPVEILNEVASENMEMVTTKQLAVIAMKRYAKLYHESKIKKDKQSEGNHNVQENNNAFCGYCESYEKLSQYLYCPYCGRKYKRTVKS